MKFFVSILAIYLLALSIVPCPDMSIEHAGHKVGHMQNAANDQANAADQCSPFCACSCCVSPMVHQAYVIIVSSLSFSHYHYPKYHSFFFSTPLKAIWQPPKLS